MSGQQLGSLAGGLVGGVAGAFMGGPLGAVKGFAIGSTVGGMAGNAISPTKGPHSTVQGPRLGDLSVQSSTYGGPIPIIYGTIGQIAGNVIWQTPLVETAHTSSSSSSSGGGKGGPPKATTTTTNYTYSVSLAIGLCAGPIGGIKRIWANGALAWDATNPLPNGMLFRLYYGDETQLADPTIEAAEGVGNVPGFRGMAYIVLTNWELGPYGNRVPNLAFELIGQGTPAVSAAATHTTVSSLLNRMEPAIDTQTGLIWLAHIGSPAPYLIYVLRPDTWAVVRTITMPAYGPHSIVYQPGYSLSGTAVPARMWVGNANNSNRIWSIDTASYAVTEYTVVTPINQQTTGVAIDLRPIGSTGVATGPVYVLCGGSPHTSANPVTGIVGQWSQFNRIDTSLPLALINWDTMIDTSLTAAGAVGVSEGVSGQDGFYMVDNSGQVFKLSGDFAVINSYTAFNSGGNTPLRYRITYNPDEDCVYASINNLSSQSVVLKFDADLNVLWTRNFTVANASTCMDVKYQRGSGTVWATTVPTAGGLTTTRALNLTDGTDLRANLTTVVGEPTGGCALPYPNADFMIYNTDMLHTVKLPLTPVASGTVTLDQVVSDLNSRSALTAGDIDVTGLGSLTIAGYMVSTRTTVRAAIEPLCRAFFFDGVESEHKIKFTLRGGASVVTIPSTEVAAHAEGGEPPDPLAQAHAQDADLPHEVEVTYPDVVVDYHPVLQYARRLTGHSKEKMAFQIPVVVSAAGALTIANVLLYVAWTERDTYTLSVMRKYAYLDPGDCITYAAADGTLTVMRITKIDFAFPLLLNIEAVKDDPSIYAGFTYAAGIGGYVSAPITAPVPTVMHLMDVPLFRDIDDNAGFYIAGNGYYAGWTGGRVYQSKDAGATYNSLVTLSIEPTLGYATTVLATTASPEIWDDTNTVDVTISAGTIATATDLEVYAGANAAMLGSELIQFGTVTSLGGSAYRLSHLLRGRNGSEWAVGTHTVNDTLIVLASDGSIVRQPMALAEVGVAELYKAASAGQYLSDLSPTTFTNTAVGLKPYAPCSVAGVRDGSNNLTLTWIRRARTAGAWRDYVDVALDEDTESYSIDIMNGAAVLRTLTSVTPTVVYSAANQTTDGITPGNPVTAKIYQISAQVGRGYAKTATV